jgi:hypothetical protein
MRSRRTADRQAIDRCVTSLVALLEAGHEEVRIVKVISLLGIELKKAGPAPDQVTAPDPRADPITGCLPVTAGPE